MENQVPDSVVASEPQVLTCKKCGNEVPAGTKFCPKCGKKIASPSTVVAKKEKINKKNPFLIGGIVAVVAIAVGVLMWTNLACDHDWKSATCIEPQTCQKCGKTKGELGGHSWENATHTSPKTCKVCKLEEGDAIPYSAEEKISLAEWELRWRIYSDFSYHSTSNIEITYTESYWAGSYIRLRGLISIKGSSGTYRFNAKVSVDEKGNAKVIEYDRANTNSYW